MRTLRLLDDKYQPSANRQVIERHLQRDGLRQGRSETVKILAEGNEPRDACVTHLQVGNNHLVRPVLYFDDKYQSYRVRPASPVREESAFDHKPGEPPSIPGPLH